MTETSPKHQSLIHYPQDNYRYNEIQEHTNIMTEDLYEELFSYYFDHPVTYGWKSNNKTDPHGHLNFDVAKANGWNVADVTHRMGEIDKKVWEFLKENYSVFKDCVPIRNYINVHPFGLDGYVHKDSERKENETTIVIYLVRGKWNKDWGGETVFLTDDEEPSVIRAVMPRKNSAVIFNANISHVGRGISRTCMGKRVVYVIKTRKLKGENFEKLSACLEKHGANYIPHGDDPGEGGKRLHNHLMQTFEILERKGCSEEVCFGGGLHSVFGTNSFKDNICGDENQPELIETFGERAVFLARLFSVIDRPKALEQQIEEIEGKFKIPLTNGKQITLNQEIYDQLRMIECANLIDQKMLDKEKYSNLYKLWRGEQDNENNK
jgi:SM-20-related protein